MTSRFARRALLTTGTTAPHQTRSTKSLKRRGLTIFATVAALTLIVGAPASAATGDEAPSPEEIHSQTVGNTLTDNVEPIVLTAEVPAEPGEGARGPVVSGTVTCVVDAQNPHISTGAGYVIYKTRINCTGTGTYPPAVTVLVRGALMWDSAQYAGDTSNGIVWSTLRSSSESRSVSVNGSNNTFYTPQLGTAGAYFKGHYQGSSTAQIMSLPSNVGSDISNVQFFAP